MPLTIEIVAKKIERYRPMAMYFAKNKMLAEDVLQDLFIKINKRYEKVGNLDFITYKDDMNDSYVFLMIRSCYTDIVRKEKRYSDAAMVETSQEPIEPNIISKYLVGLDWYEKQLTEVYFNEEHTIRSLATATKISKTNIHLTLKKTKKVIKHNIEMDAKKEISDYVKEKTKGEIKKKRGPKPNSKPKGLGDSIENLTKKTGIKKLVDKFTPEGKDCGCDKRKELLNKMFPYKRTKCMTQEQFNIWTNVLGNIGVDIIKDKELKEIALLHSELFEHTYYEPCRCAPKEWKHFIRDIDKIYKTYSDEV